MMGRLVVQEALFYQPRLEDFIPPDHLLRRMALLHYRGLRRDYSFPR